MDLKKFYLDSKFPGSYSGAYKFYQEVKNIHPKVTLKKVNEFLKSQDAYTLHKRTRKPKFRRTLVFKPRDLWQIDLLDMQKYSKENEAFGPKLYHTYTDKKAAIVERVQRTLRGRLGRLFTKRGNFKWIDKIDDIVTAYNNSYHRTIKMKPADVDEEHIANIFFNSLPNLKKTIKFSNGDRVRILIKKNQFAKEFEKSWSEEIFKIKRIQNTNPITYLIEDLDGEDIIGGFYTEELQAL